MGGCVATASSRGRLGWAWCSDGKRDMEWEVFLLWELPGVACPDVPSWMPSPLSPRPLTCFLSAGGPFGEICAGQAPSTDTGREG